MSTIQDLFVPDVGNEERSNNTQPRGCRHSEVDSSATTILQPRVRVPSTLSTLLSLKSNLCYICCVKNTENKQKSGRVWPIFLKATPNQIIDDEDFTPFTSDFLGKIGFNLVLGLVTYSRLKDFCWKTTLHFN